MGDIIEFKKDSENLDDTVIKIELEEECKGKLEKVNKLIGELPIRQEDKVKLAELVTKSTCQAMGDAYLQGFKMGIKITEGF